MGTPPKHGPAAEDMSWLASINPTPPGYPQPPAPPVTAGGRISVVTRPSIPRIAVGVYLGLMLFAATGAGLALLAVQLLADTDVLSP